MPLEKNQIIPLVIESISNDGNGVGRFQGQAVFVPGSAVGDCLECKIIKAAKKYAVARIEQITEAGPGRVSSDCPASSQCGGCTFRHMTYKAELEAKYHFVADALQRIGGFSVIPQPPLPSPQINRYRNKVQYPVAAGANQAFYWGFFATRSHRIVTCDDCLLQPELINRVAAHTATVLGQLGLSPYQEQNQSGLVRHIGLRRGHYTGQILVCLVVTRFDFEGKDRLAAALTKSFPEITTILLNKNNANTNVIYGPQSEILYGDGWIEDTLCGVPLRLNEHTFSQVNTLAAEQLFALVQQLAAPSNETVLLDLYCGTGVIGLSMAGKCRQLVGVELTPQSIESARQSATAMGLANTRFICGDAGNAAQQLASERLHPHIVVVDPPRKGMDIEAAQAILQMCPQRIVMVSCNPSTLARDLRLLADGGYQLNSAHPVDMFPRTRHVECVCLLERTS